MFRSDGERRSFSIARDMTVIGRREDCDLRIPLGEVSRKHCRLVRDGDTLKIEDLGSSNGTFLNARRVQEAMLSPGDSIQVGPVVFVLQIDGTPADEELSPVTMDAAAGAASGSGMAEAAEGAEGELEELDPLEEAGAEAPLEEINDESAAPSSAKAGGDDDDVHDAAPAAAGNGAGEVDPLEPLEELEGLDHNFDITEETTPASSASGELRIDLDADEKNR